LLCRLNPGLSEFYRERVLLNLFKKSGSEDIADLMHATDNSFGDLVQPRSAFIGVHRRLNLGV
jgi:hypothetical protein